MPPSGPRARPAPPAGPSRGPGGNVRNEAFENIFGRPAGGHHMGGPGPGPGVHPHPPPGGGYGYPQRPPGPRDPHMGNGYLNPSQPSYPPGMAPQFGAPPPPRGAPSFPPQIPPLIQPGYPPPRPDFSQPPPPMPGQDINGFRNPAYAPIPQFTQPAQAPETNRRASLAPSVYSISSNSFYSPTPDTASPAEPSVRRMPSSTFPAPARVEPPPRQANGSLAPTSTYSASVYDHVPSPASSVFPHRAAGFAGPSRDPSIISGMSSVSASTRSTPARPTLDLDTTDRYRSPSSDLLRDMEHMGFDGEGGGPLDLIPGIPKKGSESPVAAEFGKLAARYSGEFRTDRPSLPHRRTDTQSSLSSFGNQSLHKRIASDSSLASSGGFTMRNVAPLSSIEGPISPIGSLDTPTGSDSFNFTARANERKSMESTHSLPGGDLPPGATTGYDVRATSFSGSSTSRKEALAAVRSGSVGHGVRRPPGSQYSFASPQLSNRSLHGTLRRSHSSARHMALASIPTVYPALLSKVAEVFKQLVSLSELVKDGITYKDSFDGRTAVSIIAEIIKTPDRNLALLLGRALDAQKMFHDVTYDHRLRDNPHEIYQFKERLAVPFMPVSGPGDSPSSENAHLTRHTSSSSNIRHRPGLPATPESSSLNMSDSQFSFNSGSNTPATSLTNLSHPAASPQLMTKINSGSSVPQIHALTEEPDSEDDLPVGVFTLLTDCYSPTCSRESLCYSINCPRRLEQMKRLNMKPTGLSRKLSEESIHDVKETGTLWIHSVSQEILDSVDDTEKKRQEAINEVIYTERDFVRDLEYLKEQWVKPLLSGDTIPANRKEDFVRQVFWNVHDVWSVNHLLAERLTKRQKQQPVVSAVGDLFLERVPLFEPFVAYGAHQLFGKYEFEKEKGANPAFQKFVDETERKPESRKLELNGYLTKPTTRLGRYPLLLEAVLKYTPEDHQDKRDLPEAIQMIRSFLQKVNVESGKSENIFELAQTEQQLVWRPGENIDLRLRDKSRELVHKGPLKRRGGNRDEIADLTGFLFDHAFLLVKPKYVNKAEQLRVYRRPIPLELLVCITPDESYNAKLSAGRGKLVPRTSTTKSTSSNALSHVPPKPDSKHGFSITIVHLGRKGYQMQLWVDTYVSRKKWLEAIDKQQAVLRDRSCVFACESITEGFFHGMRRINCISPYDNGNRVIYGTDEGVYFSNLRDSKLREPVKVINILDVTQVDVIEEFQLLIVLHERSVTTFPLDCLDPNDPNSALKRGKRIASHTSFFKSGVCLGKMLVAVVKSSTLSSTIKVLEPVDQAMRGKKQQGSFMKRLNGGNEALRLFKEFYIPTESSSVHFLKTKLCVGCTKGFEIVDLETLDMQGLLDPSDQSLDFVLKRDNVRPIAIYRIEEDFLLCYDEFAFYVNKNGWRSRPKWAIIWEGMPHAFALQYPYVIAFEPTFIEVRSVHTGDLVQIIPGHNITCLFADTPPSRVNAAPPPNRQMMFPSSGGPPGSFRAPSATPYSQPQFPVPQPAYPGYGPPRPPPIPGMAPGGGSGFMPPQPTAGARYARDQIIFTSEDGHVQFLKLPPPPAQQGRPPMVPAGSRETPPPAAGGRMSRER